VSSTVKIAARLSAIDRFLPVWIFAAMGLGIALGRVYPAIGPMLDTVKVGGVSLPIAVGLFWMMYPVLAKVRYGKLGSVGANGKLGLPLVAGAATRGLLVRAKGESWYEGRFLPKIGPTALLGLLYTIVLMFAMQGDKIVRLPLDVVRIAIPLVLYFVIMFGSSFLIAKKLGFSYEDTASLAFTAAGNNFELAIAVSVGLFGIASGEALAGVVGPLIEVPALLALVYLSLWLQRRLFPDAAPAVSLAAGEGPSTLSARSRT
jgi:ACR3 family arsenite efflux pump ArsB